MVWWIVYWGASALAVCLALLLSLQAWEHRRFVRSRIAHPRRGGSRGHVAIVVACKGHEPQLEANLSPLFEQTYGDYQLVFAVEDAADPCCRVIRRLQSRFPQRTSQLIVAGRASESGQKVHNLLAATAALGSEATILAFVDADVRPSRKWLANLTQRFDVLNVATGYRWFVPQSGGLANCLLPSINSGVISLMFPGKQTLVWGGSWAIRRATFERLRLRDAWCGTLSDDLVASCVLSAAHEHVSVEPACIVASPLDVDFRQMFAFLRRQLTIGRLYVPRLWNMMLLLTCLSQFAFWSSVAVAAYGYANPVPGTWLSAAVVAVLYALHAFRAWLRQEAAHSFLSRRSRTVAMARQLDIWAAPVATLVGCFGLLSSAVGRKIVWKGIAYEMGARGRVSRIDWLPNTPEAERHSLEMPCRESSGAPSRNDRSTNSKAA